MILAILSEIFDDIDECSIISEEAGDQQHTIHEVAGLDELISMSAYHDLDSEFNDLDIVG